MDKYARKVSCFYIFAFFRAVFGFKAKYYHLSSKHSYTTSAEKVMFFIVSPNDFRTPENGRKWKKIVIFSQFFYFLVPFWVWSWNDTKSIFFLKKIYQPGAERLWKYLMRIKEFRNWSTRLAKIDLKLSVLDIFAFFNTYFFLKMKYFRLKLVASVSSKFSGLKMK